MDIMKCFDNYQDDRICDLCDKTNNIQYRYCKNLMKLQKNIYKLEFVSDCPHQTEAYDDWQRYYKCKLYNEDCCPRELCMKDKYDDAVKTYDIMKERYISLIKDI